MNKKTLKGLQYKLDQTPSNTHACHGYHVVVYAISNREGIVLSERHCGHCFEETLREKEESSFPQEYMFVRLPRGYTWEEASQDREDLDGEASETKVTPLQLEIYRRFV